MPVYDTAVYALMSALSSAAVTVKESIADTTTHLPLSTSLHDGQRYAIPFPREAATPDLP
jgi:hypothetical protein